MRRIRHLEVVPIVVGALGVGNKRLDTWLEKLGITIRMGNLVAENSLVRNSKDHKEGVR